jgi:hypothetical protein
VVVRTGREGWQFSTHATNVQRYNISIHLFKKEKTAHPQSERAVGDCGPREVEVGLSLVSVGLRHTSPFREGGRRLGFSSRGFLALLPQMGAGSCLWCNGHLFGNCSS